MEISKRGVFFDADKLEVEVLGEPTDEELTVLALLADKWTTETVDRLQNKFTEHLSDRQLDTVASTILKEVRPNAREESASDST